MTIITLTTDFGQADGYVGTMKGVILGIAPSAVLVDLTHEVAPQDVRQASYILKRTTDYFPEATVHLAVIDPGVGSRRRALLVTTPRAMYVGPDNGIFTFALDKPGAQAWELDQPSYWLTDVSRTFHGRDIFAPVAAHLARGILPQELGHPIASAVRLPQPAPQREGNEHITGNVIHVDRFGNLITDVPASWVAGADWLCEIAGRRIDHLSDNYAAVESGDLLALVSSDGTVEVAARNASAAQLLRAGPGVTIELWRKGAFNGEVHHRRRPSPLG